MTSPFDNAAVRLAKLSMSELNSVYDAVSLARDCLLGMVNQPRFYTDTDDNYNNAGEEVNTLIDVLTKYAGVAIQAAQTASPADPHEVQTRAWLLLKYSAQCGDNLDAHAADSAGLAAQVATLKKLKNGR
ncbi:hypothetical protein GOB29_19760 [Sinorhizobium meliloti]|nr:hypothetical protein [Sinorhizobium meliloti]